MFCIDVYLCTVCMPVAQATQKRALDFLGCDVITAGLEIQTDYESPYRCWELSWVLRKSSQLLTAEPDKVSLPLTSQAD